MGLFFPILLLGLAAPGQQASPVPPIPNAQAAVLSQGVHDDSVPDTQSQRQRTFDSMAIPITGNGNTCYFIRSYYFERRDDLAPEYRGMTTCDPGNHRSQKRVGHERGKLVPVSEEDQTSRPK